MPRPPIHHPDLPVQEVHGILTVAPEMLHLLELLKRAARSDATVLVRGESGTGKELVANALHAASPRANKPFRAVNCATFTPELLASELFGHVRGAFTGAVRDKAGVFAQADGGTLFLDEVAEMPLDLQARLLRVLQQRRFMPVGGTQEVSVDVRVVSATNAALRQLVQEGSFREDLMYRIRVVVLYLPRLVDRTGDLEALTWNFIDRLNERCHRRIHAIDADAWDAMQAYSWPGNIRELLNNLEQAFVLGDGPVLRLSELAPELAGIDDAFHPTPQRTALGAPPAPLHAAPAPLHTVEDLQREAIEEAFRATGGRREAMAERLGISRSTLYRRMRRLGMA